MLVENLSFRKIDIHKYTWMRQDNGRVVGRAMMDYVVVSWNIMGWFLHVRILRGKGRGMSDHYHVEGVLRESRYELGEN